MPIAFVTGASSGIGEATARHLAGLGITVYAGARRVDLMTERLGPHGIRVLRLDVTDDASMRAAVDRILTESHGRIDALVNNAGYGSYGAVEDVPIDEARRQFEVNLFGMGRLTQLVLPAMRRRGRGRIVNISSIGGKIYEPMGAWYHATKYAVEGFSDSLRLEVRPFGVKVVIIEPGLTESEWVHHAMANLVGSSADGAYADQARRLARIYLEGDRRGLMTGPDVVAKAIGRAIIRKNPRTRYAIGMIAKPTVMLRRVLPDVLIDPVMSNIARGETPPPRRPAESWHPLAL
jgi:NAD(P)-dependent dehydrogenase (short-subunit alcohol dehydrogenase family)